MSKLPALQFYPADWRKDLGVQSLSFHERGVWFEMLCLMHESADRGRLVLKGKPMPDETIARLLGLILDEFEPVLKKLLESGVTERDKKGAIINRRMIRDEKVRKIRQNSGKKGGNPTLRKLRQENDLGDLVKQESKNPHKQKPTPSSSSSVTSSSSDKKKRAAREPSGPEDFLSQLKANPAYRHIDIDREAAKAEQWCKINRRECTQRFFVNWLNRMDPPLPGRGPGRPPDDLDQSQPPPIERAELRPRSGVHPDQRRAWIALLDALKLQIPREAYDSWFTGLLFDGFNQDRNAFLIRGREVTVDWVRRVYAGQIIEGLSAIGMGEFTLQWEIDEGEEIARELAA